MIRPAILQVAVAFVNSDPSTALGAVSRSDIIEARDLFFDLVNRTPTGRECDAIEKATRYEARRQADAAMADDEHPLAWGKAHTDLSHAMDRDAEQFAACGDCDGRGHDENGDRCCWGGIAVQDVTADALRLRDEALAGLEPALVVVVAIPSAERAA